jgi:hypothetical protein
MAVLGTDNLSLLDLAQRSDPNGQIATVIEIMNERQDVLMDMSWQEGNLPTGHLATVRTGIPEPTARRMNMFVPSSKSTTGQITFSTGMFEDWAVVDKAVADLNGNAADLLLSEEVPHIEGFNQKVARTLFYGNETVDIDEFTGLASFYNDLSAENADNIIDADGASTDNGSIWLAVWSPMTVHGIVPKGSVAGMQRNYEGVVTVQGIAPGSSEVNGFMRAHRTHYRWDAGLALPDWRYVVRIANIDKSDLSTTYTSGAFSTGAHLPNLMFEAIERIPNIGAGRPVFYMSRNMQTTLRQQLAAATQNSTLTVEQVGGVRTTMFDGIPIRRVDALAADEAEVT